VAARLRILSANLWNGAADPEALLRLLREEDVDAACLQELTPDCAEAVASVLPEGRLAPAEDGHGAGIALRAPAEIETLPLVRRALCRAQLHTKHWPGLSAPLSLWNLHLWAPHDGWRSLAIRRAQLGALLAEIDTEPAGPLVLAGDFNATPLWPAYRRIASRLDDAAALCAARSGGRPGRTWAPWAGGPQRRRWLRIDHVFARGVEVLELRRLHLPGSDHDALCADLALG